jgi:pimeloyl-ACP methyl ester carboxylesterase
MSQLTLWVSVGGCAVLVLGVWYIGRVWTGWNRKTNGSKMDLITTPQPTTEVPRPSHTPYKSLFCDLNERTIHYVQMGQGPHLVLIHGIAASLYIWRFLLPELAKHYTVTALDLPGFGFSSKNPFHDYGLDQQADNVAEFLDAIGIKEAGLVGSSMGGAVALWLARKYPERFGRIATISPSTNPGLLKYLSLFPLRPLFSPIVPFAKSFRYLANSTTARVFVSRVVSKPELVTEESVNAYLRPFLEGDESFTTLLKATRLIGDRRMPGELKSVENPVLVLWGKQDRLVPYRYVEELIAHLPSCQFESHPSAGHHSMEDEPEWVLEHVKKFFSHKA